MKEVEVLVEEYNEENMAKPKGYFYIRNALDQVVWIKTRDREKAQNYVDSVYGKGHYTVKFSNIPKGASEVTVKATATRKGQYVQSMKSKILNS